MSKPITTEQYSQSQQGIWSTAWATVSPYIVPPIAASAAVIPVFYGFIAKSAQQAGNPIPKMGVVSVFKEGCKAAPTVGAIVGTQMVVQNIVEKALKKRSNEDNPEATNFATMLMSAVFVGAVSAPALAVFNGQTMGKTMKESIRSLSFKQTCAIVTRETSFLFALRVSDPIAKEMKRICGDNQVVEYGSAFTSGAIGSVIGHPADTALTLWQKGMGVKNISQLMKGAPIKAMTVGGFSVCYKVAKEMLEPKEVPQSQQ